jgi:hypothetical protein
MSITPAAIQQLLDELEASKRSRQRAWEVLQELRGVLSSLGNIKIEAPAKRTFDAEGAILKQVLSDCLRDRHTALAQLADAFIWAIFDRPLKWPHQLADLAVAISIR